MAAALVADVFELVPPRIVRGSLRGTGRWPILARGSLRGPHDGHYPDLAVEAEPGGDPLAIELELTPKAPRRLKTIMRLYKRARHLSGVRYYVRDELTANAVKRAIAAAEVNEHREFATIVWRQKPQLV